MCSKISWRLQVSISKKNNAQVNKNNIMLFTPPKFNSSPLKIDGSKTNVS